MNSPGVKEEKIKELFVAVQLMFPRGTLRQVQGRTARNRGALRRGCKVKLDGFFLEF